MLFAFDLDGTLITKGYDILDENVIAIKELKKQGHKIALVSGRPFIEIMPIQNNYGFIDYISPNNGAGIYNVAKDSFTDMKYLETQDVLNLIDFAIENKLCLTLMDIKMKTMVDMSKKVGNEQLEKINKIKNEIKKGALFTQVSMQSFELPLKKEFNLVVKNFPNCSVTLSSNICIDVPGKDVNKSNAVSLILEKEGMKPNDAYVFGDALNDFQMLKNFKNSFAMDNADEEIKVIANRVIGHHMTPTIAEIINEVLAKKSK